MPNRPRPWGVHTIGNLIAPRNVSCGLPDGTVGRVVTEPYYVLGLGERLRAAWWVFTGRAHAMVWPTHLDLNAALNRASDRGPDA